MAGPKREKQPASRGRGATDFDAIIIGAGFSGLYMLHRARDVLGLRARIFEAGDGVGGTWYWNRYPGARCDSESFYYCYSFSKELLNLPRFRGHVSYAAISGLS